MLKIHPGDKPKVDKKEAAKGKKYAFYKKNHGQDEEVLVDEENLTGEHIALLLTDFYEHFAQLPEKAQDLVLDRFMTLAKIETAKLNVMGGNQPAASRIVSPEGRPFQMPVAPNPFSNGNKTTP